MKKIADCFVEPEAKVNEKNFKAASYLRKNFNLEKELYEANLSITACGLYKCYINGKQVTDQVFTPGFTYYAKRLQYQSYKVTSLLKKGTNTIAVVLGDGWFRGKIGVFSKRNHYGVKTKLAAVLTNVFGDGSSETITTDESWKTTKDGPIRKSDWKDGEIYDARMELNGWNEPVYDDSTWHEVYPSSYEGQLIPAEGEPVREQETFTPDVLTTPDGSTVLDFKQNIFGYVKFTVTGTSGHQVKLVHGETLDEHGNFTLKNIVLEGGLFKSRGMFQEIHYTLKEGRQSYKPSFTAHGFRYVKLENWPERVVPENFVSIAVYSDMEETGYFECSHKGINKLVENTRWGQKSNFMDIPTDCPTRERAGWLGDIMVFCETGSYLMNTYQFLTKWLGDLALQQDEDGRVPSIVPSVGMWKSMDGSAGWGDAAIIIPYTLYKIYGKKEILVNQYESMKKWLQFLENRAARTKFYNKLKRNPYKKFIIDTGYHWGEWLEPGHVMAIDAVKNFLFPDAEVATAYYAYSSGLFSKISKILGNKEETNKYKELSENIKVAYRHTFTSNGLVESNRQCRYVRPVALDLLPEPDKKKNVERLNKMVIENDYKIGTGFLTTPFILGVLTDYGYADTAFKMVENKKRPGWLYEVEKGATTIWENWNGIDENGVPKDSLNHYAFGTVTGWFYSKVAGITPLEPGYKKIKIKPVPGGSLEFADCKYKSASGLIKIAWKKENDNFMLEVEIPTNAEVFLPDGTRQVVGKGKHEFSCNLD